MSFESLGTPGEVIRLRLPRPAGFFARRARRFEELAPGNPMGEFLEALGAVARAQEAALATQPAAPGPAAGPVPGAAPAPSAGAAPLQADAAALSPAWREALRSLVAALGRRAWPGPAAGALQRLATAPDAELDALAAGVLGGDTTATDLAASPFVGAALQVHFTALAARLDPATVPASGSGCPVCGSPPVAGVVLGDDKLRYLCCSLCGSEWNATRIQCWSCQATGGIRYLGIAGDPGGMKAELCRACGTYLKLFYLEKMPAAEPLADDVASLTLDLLAAQDGWGRSGVNLFLLGGAED